jgi:hypothetical protein
MLLGTVKTGAPDVPPHELQQYRLLQSMVLDGDKP